MIISVASDSDVLISIFENECLSWGESALAESDLCSFRCKVTNMNIRQEAVRL